jgi:broad specificity phosphatase PhoE
MQSALRRLVLVRHGETDGNSRERLIGSGDPNLSAEGRDHMLRARASLTGHVVDLVVTSPARRAFQSAAVLTGGATARIEPAFREIHFGRWEGRSLAEIESADPALFQEWQAGAADFEYPGGELRAAFRKRVIGGLERVATSGATGALVVTHRGVIREIVQHLCGAPLDRAIPALGEAVVLTLAGDGSWRVGSRSSNPEGIPTAAPVQLAS